MPLLVFAGIPKPVGLRNRAFVPTVPGWDTVVIPSGTNDVSVKASWRKVLQTVNEASDEGAHIMAFHPPSNPSRVQERRGFEASIYARHRLIWLDTGLLELFGNEQFNVAVKHVIDFEDEWRLRIRPPDHRHALILPEDSFTPDKALSTVWARAQRVKDGVDSLERVSKTLDAFRRRHYRDGVWIDNLELVFDPNRQRHGEAAREFCWKYTYLVPSNFHYDVQSSAKHRFRVSDHAGTVHSFSRYTNIDCRGVVRGGQ